MSAGFTMSRADFDQRIGGLVVAVRDALFRVHDWKSTVLDNTNVIPNDQFLLNPPFAYSQPDVDLIRASFTDLDKIYLISHAGAVQAAPSDFFTNAQKLTGFARI
jgi:hypothetical protein